MTTRKAQVSGQFIDWFPYISCLIAGVLLVSLIAASVMGRTLISTNVNVTSDTPVELTPIQLKKEPIGALRIDVVALLPANTWVTYEILLKDAQGKVLASGIKQAWSESGTWAEDGESGSWAEDDLIGGLDVRTNQAEPVTIALDVLEYSDTAGRELDVAVPFKLTVKNGVVDDRYFWAGFVGTSLLAFLAMLAVPTTGRVVMNKSNRDSDVVGRTEVGGNGRLLRIVVKVKTDEFSPHSVDARLSINDANGEQIYSCAQTIRLNLSKSDNRVTSGSGSTTIFVVLEPRSSYGFHVEIYPDQSVDRTRIIIRDRARTLLPVEVVQLKST